MVYSLVFDPDVQIRGTVEIEIIADETSKIELVDDSPDDGINLNKPMQNGRPIIPRFVPKTIRCLNADPIPDYQTWQYCYLVSDKFKAVLEAVEPGVHQFFPVEYLDVSNQHRADMWILNICNRLDSVEHERTESTGMILAGGYMWMPAFDVPGADRASLREKYPHPKTYFSKVRTAGKHIWFDKFSIYGPYISDELAAALNKADLFGVKLWPEETF